MPEALVKLQQQIVEFWKNLDKSQKTRIIVTSGVVIVAVVIALIILTRTTYVPLLSIGDSSDAQEILKVLDEKQINYKEGDDGKILVDAKDKTKAQFSLSVAGLTKSGMAFEDAWNLIKISSTENDKKKLWDNLLKQDIRTKLLMFDNIKDANIVLTVPEKSVFVESSDEKAKANVIIVPKSGEITSEQAQAIVRVVASSIEGLDPKNVSVVDNNLNDLTGESSSSVGVTASQYKMRMKVKDEIEKNIRNLYTGRSDSYDAIKVVANPVLDFNTQKSKISDVQKPTGLDEAVVSQQKTNKSLVNGSAGVEPGVGSNPGTTTSYQIGTNGNSTYDEKGETINRKFKEILTEEEKALGDLDLDKSSITVALWYGERVLDDSNITPEFINQVKEDVSGATGIPVAKVSVNKYKLAPLEVETKAMKDVVKELFDSYGLFALMLILIVGLLIAVRPKKKVSNEPEAALNQLAMAGSDVDVAVAGPRFIIPEEEEIPEIEIEERSEVKKQIDKFVKQKPEAVAQLLRNWLSDDWE